MEGEADTLRRVARFWLWRGGPGFRLSDDELPHFFLEAYYCGGLELGVFRYPFCAKAEVARWCRRAGEWRAAKMGVIEEALGLWEVFGQELERPLRAFLHRLCPFAGRPLPARPDRWRCRWEEVKGRFDLPSFLLMRGIALAQDGDLFQARRFFQEAGRALPDQATHQVNLLYLDLRQGQVRRALARVRRILSRYPEEAAVLVAMGRLFAYCQENFQVAEYLFLRARARDRKAFEPLVLLGEIELFKGRIWAAEQYFEKARALAPQALQVRLGWARLYLESGRLHLASEHLLALAREGAREIRDAAHYQLYLLNRRLGKGDRALFFLEQVPIPFFKEPGELDEIASHLESEGHFHAARRFAERALVLRFRQPPASPSVGP
jgi:tetratricopeptide (TPR) repeat protein